MGLIAATAPNAARGNADKPALREVGCGRLSFWTALIVGAASFVFLAWDASLSVPWLTVLILVALGLVADWLLTAQRGDYVCNLSLPFVLAAVLLLPSPPLLIIVLALSLPGWLRSSAHWRALAFETAARITSVAVAYVAYWQLRDVGDVSLGTLRISLFGAVAAVATITIVQRLTAIGPLHRRGSGALGRSHLLAADNLVTQFVVVLTGLPIAIFWNENPWLTAAAIAPLLVVHRALNASLLEREVRTDTKTGLHNMKSFNEALKRELQRAARFGHPVSLLMIDLDLLRHVNNSYGHQAGDAVLRNVASALREEIREFDVAARFGGDEFIVMLVERDSDSALEVAEAIRTQVENVRLSLPTSASAVGATVSIGVASFPRHATCVDQLIYQADVAVYRAKLGGRNRVCLAPPPNHDPGTAENEQPQSNERQVDVAGGKPALRAAGSEAESVSPASDPMGENDAAPLGVKEERRSPVVAGPLQVLIGVAVSAAFATIVLGLHYWGAADWQGIVSLMLLTLAAEMWILDLYGASSMSLAVIPVIAAAMLYGVPGGVIVALTEGLARGLLRRSQLHRVVFNTAVFVLGAGAAGAAFDFVDVPLRPDLIPLLLLPALATALIYYAVNTSLIALAMGLATGQNPVALWRERFRWLLVHYVVLGLLGLFLAVAYRTFGIYGMLAFGAPAFAVRYAMHQYISNTTEHVSELRRLNAEMQRSNHEMARINEDLLATLAAAIDVRDPFVYGHSTKVAEYAVAVAQELRLSGDMVELIRQSALLHDIGKLGIPESILNKPARLDAEEYEQIKTHSVLGAELLTKMRRLQHLVPAIKHHHEWYNGRGYPDGLGGDQIPIEARILAVCDAIEAMASDRPYHRSMPVERIIAELKACAGAQFDPAVVEAFVRATEIDGGRIVVNSALTVRKREAGRPRASGAGSRKVLIVPDFAADVVPIERSKIISDSSRAS